MKSWVVLLGLASVAMAGCDDKNGATIKVKPALRRANDSGTGFAPTSGITIHSLRAPLREITLVRVEGVQERIYNCPEETQEGCMLEMADPAVIDILEDAAAMKVRPDVYSGIQVSNCVTDGGGEWDMEVTASIDLGGVLYHTDPTAPLLLSSTGTPAPVTLTQSGCSTGYPFVAPITLDTADNVTLQLYFDLSHVAWGGDDTSLGIIGDGCTRPFDSGDQDYLCVGVPAIAGTLDTVDPVVEHYRMNNIRVGLFFTGSGDNFFGGYTRPDYAPGYDALAQWGNYGALVSSLNPIVAGPDVYYQLATADGFRTNDFLRVAVGDTSAGMFWQIGQEQDLMPFIEERVD